MLRLEVVIRGNKCFSNCNFEKNWKKENLGRSVLPVDSGHKLEEI